MKLTRAGHAGHDIRAVGKTMHRRHPPRNAQAAQSGTTLIELIVVIILIGILSAVAYPRLATTQYDEVGYRDQVIATLAYARKAAVAQRRNVQVSLSANAMTFRIANDIPEAADGSTFAGAAGRDLILPGSDSARIAPRGRTTLVGPATLVFTPLGKASAATHAYFISGTTVRTVTVDPVTGHVY